MYISKIIQKGFVLQTFKPMLTLNRIAIVSLSYQFTLELYLFSSALIRLKD